MFLKLIEVVKEKNLIKLIDHCENSIDFKDINAISGNALSEIFDACMYVEQDKLSRISKLSSDITLPYEQLIAAIYESKDLKILTSLVDFLVKNYKHEHLFFISLLNLQPLEVIEYFLSNLKDVAVNGVYILHGLYLSIRYLMLFGPIDTLKFLLNQIKIDVYDYIFFAVETRRLDVVSVLLDHGASPDQTNRNDQKLSLLSIAINNNDVPMVNLLLKAGASKSNYLSMAAKIGAIEIIKLFIATNEELETALQHIAGYGHIEIVKQLLQENMLLDNLPLRVKLLKSAIAEGQLALINWLLDGIQNLEPYDLPPEILLEIVLKCDVIPSAQKLELSTRLIKLGANITAMVKGESGVLEPIWHTCARLGDKKLLALFDRYQVPGLHSKSIVGHTVLHSAFKGRNPEAIRYLLTRGFLPTTTEYGQNIFSSMFPQFHSFHRQVSEANTRECALLAISCSEDINKTFTSDLVLSLDIADILQRLGTVYEAALIDALNREQSTPLFELMKERPFDYFLIRSFLEAGANPNPKEGKISLNALMLHGEREFYRINDKLGDRIKIIYMVGLLHDYGAVLDIDSIYQHENRYRTGRLWPGSEPYFKALELQRNNQFSEAINILQPNHYTHYSYIWIRLGILYKLTGDFEKAFDCFQRANNPSCWPISLSSLGNNPQVYCLDISNELVDLLDAWTQTIEQQANLHTTESYQKLLELIQSFNPDDLTSNSHYKMAIFYMKAEGLTYSERHDLLIQHFSRVIYGSEKEVAISYLKNLQSPENQFKYELDRILINSDINLTEKKTMVLSLFAKVSSELKSVGFKFLLNHAINSKQEMLDTIRLIRHLSVQKLKQRVDNLLYMGSPKDAVNELNRAKEQPLFKDLKQSYFFKKKTKAVSKIENLIEEVNSKTNSNQK